MNGGLAVAADSGGLQGGFDDLYTAVYDLIDDAKGDHDLVKSYKGSHGSPDPHPVVHRWAEFFAREQRGLIAYACSVVAPHREPALEDLDAFDAEHQPRVPVRAAFDQLVRLLGRPDESPADVLSYLTSRTHRLGAYRGGSSGYDEESRAFLAAHFQQLGVPANPEDVLVFAGGAKGAFSAFIAALMCHRQHDDLRHLGGVMLAPSGYYQSLRLIPALFGGDIHVTEDLTGDVVGAWLADTQRIGPRCIYVPLVNNFDGRVLTRDRAHSIAQAVLEHNAAHPDQPVYALADDVYVDSYLQPGCRGVPIGAVTGADLGNPGLGRMSDWTLTVVTPSKTFALPTARVAFATTTSAALGRAVSHYRTVLSQGRVPQTTELAAVAAICLTQQIWVDGWNAFYGSSLQLMRGRVGLVNAAVGYEALSVAVPEGGWYLPLHVSPRLMPGASSSVDAAAVLLHYGGTDRDSGIGMLPGELFGIRARDGFTLRGTLAVGDQELGRFADRLGDAATVLSGPDGPLVIEQALQRARTVADINNIVAKCRY